MAGKGKIQQHRIRWCSPRPCRCPLALGGRGEGSSPPNTARAASAGLPPAAPGRTGSWGPAEPCQHPRTGAGRGPADHPAATASSSTSGVDLRGTRFAPSCLRGLRWVTPLLTHPGTTNPPPTRPGCHAATPGAAVPKVPALGCPARGRRCSPKPSAQSRLLPTCAMARRGIPAQTCCLLRLRRTRGKEGEQEADDFGHGHVDTCEDLGRDTTAQGGLTSPKSKTSGSSSHSPT